MQKTKKRLLMPLLWTLVIITAVASSVAMTQSAKVATLRLEQTWTYDAPEYVSITAYANNGTFGSSDTYETCIRFSNIFTGTNLIPEPSRVGYTFNGWKYKVTAEGNIWSSYSNVSDHIPFTDHLYLQAQWNANSYSITYRDGGDTSFSGSHAPNYPISHTYDTATTLLSPTKEGYTFGGWYTSSNCTGTAVTSLGATAYTNNITLFAKWSANSYTITYYDEGGSDFSGTHASGHPTSHSYGTATTLLSPTKEGYSFGGWYTTSACTGDAVTSLGATAYTDNIILYAKWEEARSYSVTITISGYYTQLYYQLGSEDSEGPLSISMFPRDDINSGDWTQASSASFTLNDIERLYIMFGGQEYECHYTIYRGTDSNGTQVCYLETYGAAMLMRRPDYYDYYYDTGVLNQDVSYYIYVYKTDDNGVG